MDDRKGNTLIIHWISHREARAKQDEIAVKDSRSHYSDPTADEAIGRAVRDEKRGKRQKQYARKPYSHPRVGVWRCEDELQNASESAARNGE